MSRFSLSRFSLSPVTGLSQSRRRSLLSLIAVMPALALLASCGSDDSSSGSDASLPPVTAPTVPGDGSTPAGDDDNGDDDNGDDDNGDEADEVTAVLEFGYYGGFVMREVAFRMQPELLVLSDGRVLTPAATAAVYPGPLVPPMSVQSITPEGLDRLIDAAREAGMLAEESYETDANIADAGTATLRVTVDGTTYLHEAYALDVTSGLGVDGEMDDDRARFASFIETLRDLPGVVGEANLGEQEIYQPDAYEMIVFPIDDLDGYEVEPTVVEWPADTGVSLSDVNECVEIDRVAVGDLFETSTELTFFAEGDATYQVVPRPAFPGRSC
ncbi:MAG: hypothetical protein ACE37B_04185 [Ilumatobacter sp.]|uniref:hypothetical protein n=1 Tax=Ilumatobacter sp. TaxID=1967498 RepID=UPI003919CB7E